MIKPGELIRFVEFRMNQLNETKKEFMTISTIITIFLSTRKSRRNKAETFFFNSSKNNICNCDYVIPLPNEKIISLCRECKPSGLHIYH